MDKILAVLAFLATIGPVPADLLISEIDLIGNRVEIVNGGQTTEDLTGYFLCNRLNGSPFYPQISTGLIDADNSDTSTLSLAPGQVLTLQMSSGFIPDGSGEVGLYSSSSFGSATALIDYVGWGANGVRDSVAAGKTPPIWENGTFVAVDDIQEGQTIQLGVGLAGNSNDDYVLADSTIGENQVLAQPSPAPLITAVSLTGGTLTVHFSGPPGVPAASWQVKGASSVGEFADDKTADSVITEDPESPGLYRALVDVASEGDSYFVRIELP